MNQWQKVEGKESEKKKNGWTEVSGGPAYIFIKVDVKTWNILQYVSLLLEVFFFLINYIIHCKIKKDNHQVPKIIWVPRNKTNPKIIK